MQKGKAIFSALMRGIKRGFERVANPESLSASSAAISGWSIVIITDGKSNDSLRQLIDSAQRELAENAEIIMVGPASLDLESAFSGGKDTIPVIHIPYREISLPGTTGWITHKKNIGVSKARYDKIVICHDYIIFSPGWKRGYDSIGNFDIATNIILNKNGKRSLDWVVYNHPAISEGSNGQAFLDYSVKHDPYQYLNGNYMVVRRDFFLANPLDERLHWGDKEDIEWSVRVRQKTVFVMNAHSTVMYSRLKPDPGEDFLRRSAVLKNLAQS